MKNQYWHLRFKDRLTNKKYSGFYSVNAFEKINSEMASDGYLRNEILFLAGTFDKTYIIGRAKKDKIKIVE